MNKRLFPAAVIILVIIIIAECVSIFIERRSNMKSSTETFAGSILSEGTSITVNETAIPEYIFNEVSYVAAEDLQSFGICFITNSDGSLTIARQDNVVGSTALSAIPNESKIAYTDYNVYINGKQIQCYTSNGYHIIPSKLIASFGRQDDDTHFTISDDVFNNSSAVTETEPPAAAVFNNSVSGSKGVIVLDPGHGKSSSSMSNSEKEDSGWVYNSSKGQWGEWRHWKTGTLWQDCEGSGCSGRAPANGSCWYPMGNGDRDKEPQINLQNSLAAQRYLESMGYTVRLTRTTNDENPSFSKRVSYCYPNNNTSLSPDADIYVCIHSNAGGGRGSAYISLAGTYDQAGIPSTYAQNSNLLGKTINQSIVNNTSLSMHGGGSIDGEPELILFCKSPVICGYLEIGFFDSANDLSILNSEYDTIGKAIADGIDTYMSGI